MINYTSDNIYRVDIYWGEAGNEGVDWDRETMYKWDEDDSLNDEVLLGEIEYSV